MRKLHPKLFIQLIPLLLVLLMPIIVVAQVQIENPLGDSNVTVPIVIKKIIGYLTSLIAIFALLALVWAGFRMITAFGNEKQVAEAKTIVLWAVIGIAVVALAYVIISSVSNSLGILNEAE